MPIPLVAPVTTTIFPLKFGAIVVEVLNFRWQMKLCPLNSCHFKQILKLFVVVGRTPWSCGLICHVLDGVVEGSKPAAAESSAYTSFVESRL